MALLLPLPKLCEATRVGRNVVRDGPWPRLADRWNEDECCVDVWEGLEVALWPLGVSDALRWLFPALVELDAG